MANTKRTTSKKVEPKTLYCKNGCSDKAKALSNFYKSNLAEYEVYGGYCPTCKVCLRKSTIDTNLNMVTMDSIKDALKKVDRPFVEEVFNMIKDRDVTNEKFLGEYLSQLNLGKYKECNYADTLDIQIEKEKIMNSKVEEVKKEEVTEDMKRFWGRGLDNQDYIDMQNMFDEYTAKEKNMTKKKLDDYKALCIYELQKSKIQYDLSRIADTQKLQGLIDNLSSSLGIQAVQKMDEDKNERFTLGLLARYHEDIVKRPIRRWVEDLGNIDPIDKKIQVYYKGGILNAMGIANPDIEEYKKEVEQYTVKIKAIEEEIKAEKEAEEVDG